METDPRYRFQHRWILGQTGTGKSTLLRQLMRADIEAGDGLFYVDPHGEDADALLELIPRRRIADVILFDPSDDAHPAPINLLEGIAPDWRPFLASSLLDTLKAIWGYDHLATPVMDQVIYNSIATLLDVPGATLLDMLTLLTRQPFRETVLSQVTDPVIAGFWADFTALSARESREMTRSTLNKIGFLAADPRIRNILGYPRSAFDLPGVLEGRILIARLPQGRLGLQKTRILGALLLARLHAAALARASRRPFHIYLDEAHQFGTGTLVEMLSGIRKFGVSLTLSHQYMDQLDEGLRAAVLGTIGTKIVFRTGRADAEALRFDLPVDNVHRSPAELPPRMVQITDPGGHRRELLLPTLPRERHPARADRIRRHSRRHHTRSKRKVERYVWR